MIKVKITKDGFVNGHTRVPKGDVIEVVPPIARYIVRNGEGEIVGEVAEVKEPPKKKATVKKKAVYKTRDMKAE